MKTNNTSLILRCPPITANAAAALLDRTVRRASSASVTVKHAHGKEQRSFQRSRTRRTSPAMRGCFRSGRNSNFRWCDWKEQGTLRPLTVRETLSGFLKAAARFTALVVLHCCAPRRTSKGLGESAEPGFEVVNELHER